MLSRSGEGRLLRGFGVGAVALTLLVCLATSAEATGEADATAMGTISIVEIRDAAGGSIPAPMGLTINPIVVGPDQGPDGAETGTGAVVYGGTAVTTGMAETTQVALTSAVNATASPAGSADGLETVSGSIQFLSEVDGNLEIDIQFDWGSTASATVTDDTLETAQVLLVDVELNESSGGSPNSLCTGGLVARSGARRRAGAPGRHAGGAGRHVHSHDQPARRRNLRLECAVADDGVGGCRTGAGSDAAGPGGLPAGAGAVRRGRAPAGPEPAGRDPIGSSAGNPPATTGRRRTSLSRERTRR